MKDQELVKEVLLIRLKEAGLELVHVHEDDMVADILSGLKQNQLIDVDVMVACQIGEMMMEGRIVKKPKVDWLSELSKKLESEDLMINPDFIRHTDDGDYPLEIDEVVEALECEIEKGRDIDDFIELSDYSDIFINKAGYLNSLLDKAGFMYRNHTESIVYYSWAMSYKPNGFESIAEMKEYTAKFLKESIRPELFKINPSYSIKMRIEVLAKRLDETNLEYVSDLLFDLYKFATFRMMFEEVGDE